jgi:hypothetical protein
MLPHNLFEPDLIISCHIRLNHHSGLLPSDFPAKTLHIISAPPFMPHAQTIVFHLTAQWLFLLPTSQHAGARSLKKEINLK